MGERRRFLDRVLRFMGIEEVTAATEDSIEQEEPTTLQHETGPDEEPYVARSRTTRPPTASPNVGANSRARAVMLEPSRFNDVQSIADRLINRDPVVVTVAHLDKETARRVLDFLGGTTYALGGHIQRVQENTFLLAPGGVEVDVASALFVANGGDERSPHPLGDYGKR